MVEGVEFECLAVTTDTKAALAAQVSPTFGMQITPSITQVSLILLLLLFSPGPNHELLSVQIR